MVTVSGGVDLLLPLAGQHICLNARQKHACTRASTHLIVVHDRVEWGVLVECATGGLCEVAQGGNVHVALGQQAQVNGDLEVSSHGGQALAGVVLHKIHSKHILFAWVQMQITELRGALSNRLHSAILACYTTIQLAISGRLVSHCSQHHDSIVCAKLLNSVYTRFGGQG